MGYSSAAMELGSGRIVNGWRVEEPLGRGAMAVVYRVRHEELGTLAALKVLDRVDPITEHRLLQEGRAQGSIHHPGIVSVLDFVRVDGHAALLLEYVPGSDLAALLAKRWMSVEEGLDLFRQIVSAVAAAHAAGLVHRDLKPSNVLVTETAHGLVAKVGDFGLVKSEHVDLTVTHAMVGTPRYMAPEQMRAARTVDARADLFALGCVLYELVCGRPAFTGDDLVELYTAKSAGHYASPDRLVPGLPRPVVLAITGCLEGAPVRRIPSCGTLLAVLSGAPWSASVGADETLDVDLSSSVCPACGAPVPADVCPACGADPSLAQRYRLVDALSAHVWRALDLREGRWVVLRAAATPSDADRAHLDRGARVLRELSHPQIVRGLAPPFDEHGRRWEVRELVEGSSLAEVLSAHRFDEAEVLEVIQELAAPLRYLAERSPPVVHQALSPAHVMRAEDGRLVLIDFSQVRDVRGDGSLHDRPDAAPEQWVGEATPAADVFGLGALAVTLLTRRPAHEWREGDRIRFEAHVAVSEETRALLASMLAPEPADRPSIGEVARRAGRIAAALRRPTPAVPAVLPRRRSAWLVPVGLGLGVLALPFVVVFSAVFFVVMSSENTQDRAPQLPLAGEPSPSRILEPGADLAQRPIPGADCGQPFDQPIRVEGSLAQAGTRVPLYARTRCAPDLVALGTFEIGADHVLHLPGSTTLVVPWSQARCGSSSCSDLFLDGPVEDRIVVTPGYEDRSIVKDRRGEPVSGAVLTPSWLQVWDKVDGRPDIGRPAQIRPAERFPDAPSVVSGPDGTVVFPWNFYGPYALTVDGVLRRSHWSPVPEIGFVVEPAETTAELVIVDAEGLPVAGAEVLCDQADDAQVSFGGWTARTGADGVLRCDVPEDGESWAVISAPGFVSTTTPLIPPTLRVELLRARTVHVGCAGTPGSVCTTLATPPVCAGAADHEPSGTCRFDGPALTCECNPTADRIVHGVLGTVELPPRATGAWFDLRAIGGTVEGIVPPGSARCTVALKTSRGGVKADTDPAGRFSIVGVPEGRYLLDATCRNGANYRPQEVHVGSGVTQVTLSDGARTGPVRLAPELDAPAPEPMVERQLVDYRFPKVPDGEPWDGFSSCTARVDIAADGTATQITISGCPDAFREPAAAAVRTWRWKPGPEATTEELLVPFER